MNGSSSAPTRAHPISGWSPRPAADPGKASWTEVLAHRPEVMLAGMTVFANHYVLTEREGGLPHLRVTDFRTGAWHRIAFPEPVYTAGSGTNAEYETGTFRYTYQSFVTPSSVFDYDMDARASTLLKQTEVLGGYDPTRYESERVWARAGDGTRVPISIVHRKGFARDGSAPMLLGGYGSYGISHSATFNCSRVSLLQVLRQALIASVNATCEECALGIDLSRAHFSVDVFAQTLLANCEQTAQVIRNNVSQPPNMAATYEDLWKMTLVNYNAGSGCLGLAIQDALTTENSIAWDVLSNHFTEVCAAARGYVNDISK